MQQPIILDTHTLVKRLVMAGMPELQAEVIAQLQTELTDRLVSREYFDLKITEIEGSIRRDMKEMESSIRRDMKEMESSIRRDMKEIESSIRRDMKEMESAIRCDMKEIESSLKHDLKELESRIVIKLGAMLVIAVTSMATLIKLL